MVTPLIAVRGSLVDISAPAVRAVSVAIALVMVAAFAPPTTGETPATSALASSEPSAASVADRIHDFVRAQPSRPATVRTAAQDPHTFVAAGYYDVCGDAGDGPVDLRRTQIEHEDEDERYAFAAIACEAWTIDDLGDQMLVWEIYDPDGRGDGPDYAVVILVDDVGELSVRVLWLPSDDEDEWDVRHEGQALRLDDHDVFTVFDAEALDHLSLFHFELLLVGTEEGDDGEETAAVVVDALPEIYEPLPLFPFSCDLHVSSSATVTTEPGRHDEVVAAARAAGLHVGTRSPRLGIVELRGVDDVGLQALRRLPGVASAERPVLMERYEVEVTPDDPRFPDQWALPAINAPQGWSIATGSDVRVAIVDDGVDARRTDLEGRVGPGYDAVNDRPFEAGVSSDRGGHGTAVAGVAAATGDDGHGIAGVDWGVEIAPYRVSTAGQCITDGTVAEAIRHAVDAGVDVISLSLGTIADPDPLRAAVAHAEAAGVPVIAAVGNAKEHDNEAVYPASYDSVIGVGATTRDDTIAAYSNTGPSVHVVAPGGDGSGDEAGDILTLGERGSFPTEAGTSLSAPLVAAAVSLHRWLHPDATPQEVRDALAETAVDLGPPGRDDTYGHGLLDVHALLRHAGGFARLQGINRIATSVEVSRWAFETADAVVVASAANFPDALAAGALAGVLDAPLLLTGQDALSGRIATEIGRLGASEAWIVGGTAALSEEVEGALTTQAGIPEDDVHRLSGLNRWETAAAIAQEVVDRIDPTDVLIAIDGDFPDALSASAYAADLGVPLLLVGGDSLPEAAEQLLASRSWERVTAAGGTAVLSDGVFDAAREAAGVADTPRDRLSGGNRFQTSVAIADARESRTGTQASELLLATGANWPDALSAGPAAAQRGAAFLLTPPQVMTDSATEAWIETNRSRLETGWISGGSGAVSLEVARQAAAAIR